MRIAPLALWVGLMFGQDVPEPVFRSSTRLVQVDVVATMQGELTGGLKREQFEIFDNGKPQEIAVFSIRASAIGQPKVTSLPAGVVSNRPQLRGVGPVSATVILLDGLNTEVQDQQFAREQALKVVERSTRRELVAVYALGTKLEVLQEFTDDGDLLRSAVKRFQPAQSIAMQDGPDGLLRGLAGNAANAMRAANFQRRADTTTGAFRVIAAHLQGLPGRKKLIWISAALPLTFTQTNVWNGQEMIEFNNMSGQIYAPMKVLNDANIALYPVDPRGTIVGLLDDNLATMIQLAQRTGGAAHYGRNDVGIAIEESMADTDLTYTLGFYPAEAEADGKPHSISVRVKRAGVELRYRQTYSAEEAPKVLTENDRRNILDGWVNQPLEATEIAIQAAATPSAGKSGYFDVEVAVDVSGLKLERKNGRFQGSFELAIVPDLEKKRKGLRQTIRVNLTEDGLRSALEGGVVVINRVKATDDRGKLLSKQLHLAVMDNATGKTGSVRIPIAAR